MSEHCGWVFPVFVSHSRLWRFVFGLKCPVRPFSVCRLLAFCFFVARLPYFFRPAKRSFFCRFSLCTGVSSPPLCAILALSFASLEMSSFVDCLFSFGIWTDLCILVLGFPASFPEEFCPFPLEPPMSSRVSDCARAHNSLVSPALFRASFFFFSVPWNSLYFWTRFFFIPPPTLSARCSDTGPFFSPPLLFFRFS